MKNTGIIIGNSDGIGLAVTKVFLAKGWKIIGLSKSDSKLEAPLYAHHVVDVQHDIFLEKLKSVLNETETIDACIYCAGIGELFDASDMSQEVSIFEVNLIGMVKTASCVLPEMVKKGRGHFIGLSSMADEMLSPEAPSYHASKAGFSNYLEGLALALRPRGVHVSNIRFGFVDTKMAKGDVKPFMMTVDRAAQHVVSCMQNKTARYTAPWIVTPLVKFRNRMLKFAL